MKKYWKDLSAWCLASPQQALPIPTLLHGTRSISTFALPPSQAFFLAVCWSPPMDNLGLADVPLFEAECFCLNLLAYVSFHGQPVFLVTEGQIYPPTEYLHSRQDQPGASRLLGLC